MPRSEKNQISHPGEDPPMMLFVYELSWDSRGKKATITATSGHCVIMGDDEIVGVRVTTQGVVRYGLNITYQYFWMHAARKIDD